MALDLSDLTSLSRLLDRAWDLPPASLPSWLAALRGEDRRLVPKLREMLAERTAARASDFLDQGPKLDGGPGDGTGDDAGERFAAVPGDVLGTYRLIREIGHGGMASVWLAERADGSVKRGVALKMPLRRLSSATEAERFERERDLLAMLTHPQIARLYDAGIAPSGQPFIVLEHVDGLPITDACNVRRLDIPARLRMFLQVLAAVDYAHKHLVVHRDIKPSNVFVDADGQVKLLDFGIAKLVHAQADDARPADDLTRDGICAFTPRYAAPEQIDRRPISTATDVYSLGVLLYELLTGALPHAGAQQSVAEAVRAVLHAEPLRPSLSAIDAAGAAQRGVESPARLRSLIAGDLDTIVMKALRKQPGDRYGSVERFADDLNRYLMRRPIKARPASFVYRARLFVSRHQAVGLATVAGLVGALVFASAAIQQHLQSNEERARGDAVRDFMFDLVDDAETDELHPNSDPTGRQMIAGAVKRAREGFAGQPRLRGELLAELARMRGRLGDVGGSDALLQEALALLEANAPAEDAALNKARAHTAERALESGQSDRARSLAENVLTHCRDGRDCAKARLYAGTVLSTLALKGGQPDQALQQMRQSVRDSELGFGPDNRETALALLNLAVVAHRTERFDDARQALDRALAIGQDINLPLADRVRMSMTRAVVSLDLGDYAQARDRLLALLEQNASQRNRAREWRLLATAQLALGDASGARMSADSAVAAASAPTYDGESMLARQAHARALSLAGEADQAIAEMRSVIEGLRDAGFPPTTAEALRARDYLAEAHLRSGDFDAGLKQLLSVAEDLTRAPADHEIDLANTFDLIGCALREQGRASEAAGWHDKAAKLLEQKLPRDHPVRARNAVYRMAAAYRANPTLSSAAELARAASTYAQRFPGDSAWRAIAEHATDRCAASQSGRCALIL